MPHLRHWETKTNLARSEVQAFLGPFTVLCNSQQYTEEAEAHTQETDICLCSYIILWTARETIEKSGLKLAIQAKTT